MKSAIIAKQFDIGGRVFSLEGMTEGNVNDTYLAIYRKVFSETRTVIQWINTYVFLEPDKLMKNMHRVTAIVRTMQMSRKADNQRNGSHFLSYIGRSFILYKYFPYLSSVI